jgi:hypothetical protein
MIEFSDNYVVLLIKIRRGLEEFKFLLAHIPRIILLYLQLMFDESCRRFLNFKKKGPAASIEIFQNFKNSL